jgi:glycosyltransferase involved in cell wall biosynthesis
VRLRDGGVAERALGSLMIEARPPRIPSGAGEELIAVCMATFDPDPALLRRQLDSLRAQTDTSWTCVISDDCSHPERFEQLRAAVAGDGRFALSRSDERIGFYRNFERALRMAPPEAELIALCDQDDVWHPDKLALLRRSLGEAVLVFSDQRLVDRDGHILRETLWRGRANNATNLASMLIANTVTGAATLFRREVAERALPFPDSPGIEFHDHWLALIALACGELRYIDHPLYDYVQHDAAILGKVVGASGRPPLRLRPPRMREWRAAYFLGYVPGQVRAQTLLLRCADRLTPSKRRALERYIASDSSTLAFAWLAVRPLRALIGRTETLAGEWELVRGLLWFWIASWLAHRRWLSERFLLDARFPDPPHFQYRRLQRWRSRM